MKKLFTLFTMVLMAVSCFATDYTDELVLSGQKAQQKTISVNEETKGLYTVVLKDFKYGEGLGSIDLKDVTVPNVKGETDKDGNLCLEILNSKDFTVGNKLVSALLGKDTSVTFKGKVVDKKLYADIAINNTPIGNMTATFAGGLEKAPTTGISNLPVNNNEKEEIFNLQGQHISKAKPGQVVIVKKGGKAVKVVK